MQTKKASAWNAKYNATHSANYALKCSREKDMDIIEYLEKIKLTGPVQPVIKAALREYIAAHPNIGK